MAATFSHQITDFDSAARALGSRDTRKIGFQTWVESRGTSIVIRHHSTDIVEYTLGNRTFLHTDGWVSVTTGARLHEFTPYNVVVNTRPSKYHYLVNGTPWDGDTPIEV